MRLMDRTILKEMTAAFLLGLMVFTFVLLTNRILRLVELIVNKGVGIGTVLQLFLYVLPYSLVVTIPMSVLLATLATFTRMSADGELLALRGAGVGIARLLRPGIVFGILATIVAFVISVWVLPSSNQAFRNLVFEMARRQVAVGIQEGVFNNLFDGLVLFVEHLDPRTAEMHGVFLVDSRTGNERRIVVARSGRFASDPNEQRLSLTLRNGSVHFSGTEASGRYRLLTFQDYALTLDAARPFADPFQRSLDEQELTLAGLKERATTLRAAGKNFHPPIVQYHKKLALPFACLLFVLVGVPLGSRIRRGGRGLSLALSVAFALGYYLLIVAGEGLGGRGFLPEVIAMWLPNVLVGLGGCALLLHAQVQPATLRQAYRGRWLAVRS
ncbi:MAG TPA: LPS export ABC transporter permease LptF [Candidatus Baltobacteraceae bacterium]|nr:LPS export ABC transporter permease LptF [Candidatus Baltobacteraceae bacterium]